MKQFLVLTALIFLSACGTTSTLTNADLSKPIQKDHARIIVERNSSMLYLAAGAEIKANGAKIATLGRGGSVMRDLKSGLIVLEVSTPTAPGQFVVRFHANPKQTYRFLVSPKTDALLLGSAFGVAGDAIRASISDTSGYFQIDLKDSQ